MIYSCEHCNYYNIYRGNFNKHCKTKKHLENMRIFNALKLKKLEEMDLSQNNVILPSNFESKISEKKNQNSGVQEVLLPPPDSGDPEPNFGDSEIIVIPSFPENYSDSENSYDSDDSSDFDYLESDSTICTISLKDKTNIDTQEKKVASLFCKYCNKQFSFHSTLSRHIKYHCRNNVDEGIHEYVNLLNMLKDKDNKIDKIEKQMKKLSKRLQIKNINHASYVEGNQSITNNSFNFNILNYNETDYSHLTDRDYMNCIRDCNHCVKTLIEKVHFNKKKPENMNIYISSIKGNFIMVFRDNKWQVKNRQTQIDDLYEYNELMIENWYRDYHEKYPHIIDSFKRYLKNKNDDDGLTAKVKQELLLVLYNQRDIVEENRRNTEMLSEQQICLSV